MGSIGTYSHGTSWSDASSDPISDFRAVTEAIRNNFFQFTADRLVHDSLAWLREVGAGPSIARYHNQVEDVDLYRIVYAAGTMKTEWHPSMLDAIEEANMDYWAKYKPTASPPPALDRETHIWWREHMLR